MEVGQVDERTPMLGSIKDEGIQEGKGHREKVQERLESKWTHRIIIALTIIDAICVVSEIIYDLLTLENRCRCPNEKGIALSHSEHEALPIKVLSRISLAINTLFVVEIAVTLYAFGVSHYVPWRADHGFLHLVEAIVIISTFVLELVLPPSLSSITSLLILLRLWRIVKLVSGVSVAVTDIQTQEKDKEIEKLKKEIAELKLRYDDHDDLADRDEVP